MTNHASSTAAPHARTRGSRHDPRRATRGSALVEAIVALAFFVVAAAVLCGAATVGLRASRRAAVLDGLTAVAARELAVLQARGGTPAVEDGTLVAAGLDPTTRRHVEVTRDDEDVVSYLVRLTAPGAGTVQLETRVFTGG